MHGKGGTLDASGDRYEGGWKDGKMHGKGVMLRENGDRYEGDWKYGREDGKGVLSTTEGERYDGDWEDGAFSGEGSYVPEDGETDVGDWDDGQKNEEEGVWDINNGERDEEGTLLMANDPYEGWWEDDELERNANASDDSPCQTEPDQQLTFENTLCPDIWQTDPDATEIP